MDMIRKLHHLVSKLAQLLADFPWGSRKLFFQGLHFDRQHGQFLVQFVVQFA